jgi:hypothetical protein
MAKKIFINNLNTFVSRALLEELARANQGEDGEEGGEQPIIFGTYIDKDSSSRIEGIKINKMLKVSFNLSVTIYFYSHTEIKTAFGNEISSRL